MNQYIKDIQGALTEAGFPTGPQDGVAGPQTLSGVLAALAKLKAASGPQDGATGQPERIVAQQPVAKRTINEIIVHCTATPEGRPVTVDEIRAWHKDRGFRDIGYHYVVLLDGTVAIGRPEAEVGAHCLWRNEGTLGVVYVGGMSADNSTAKDTRTPAQSGALMAVVRALCAKYQDVSLVSGHNDYAAKACPSFKVRDDPLHTIPME